MFLVSESVGIKSIKLYLFIYCYNQATMIGKKSLLTGRSTEQDQADTGRPSAEGQLGNEGDKGVESTEVDCFKCETVLSKHHDSNEDTVT